MRAYVCCVYTVNVCVLHCIIINIIIIQDYKPDEDPSKFQSTKTGRGPLQPNWMVRTCTYIIEYYSTEFFVSLLGDQQANHVLLQAGDM